MSNNLSGPCVAAGLERHFLLTKDTALHSDKDLAVSPCGCPQARLCSHLLRPQRAYDRGYLLPVFPPCGEKMSVRTFLPDLSTGAITQRAVLIIAQFSYPRQFVVFLRNRQGFQARSTRPLFVDKKLPDMCSLQHREQ